MSFFSLWIPQFSAWTLAQTEPELLERPFVVCEQGRVLAASPLALEAGIEVGSTNSEAHALCRQVQILSRDISREELAWNEVQRCFYGLTDQIEAVQPGLLFAAVDATKVCGLVHHWGVQGGQANNRATAQLAAMLAEPQEIRCVRRGREEPFTNRVKLKTLLDFGLSEGSLERLLKYGYRSVGSVDNLSREQVRAFLNGEADWLYYLAQGSRCATNLRPVSKWRAPEEVSSYAAFDLPVVEEAHWEAALEALIQQACGKLGGRLAQSLEVIANTAVNPLASRILLRTPACSAQDLKRPATMALREALKSLFPLSPVILGMEVRLGALTVPVAVEHCSLKEKAIHHVGEYFDRVSEESRMGWQVFKSRHNPFRASTWSWNYKSAEPAAPSQAAERLQVVAANTIQGEREALEGVCGKAPRIHLSF